MPSVDRVGRHFPLTLATPLDSMTAAAHAVFDGGAWFAALEDAALTALDLSRNADDLDGVLALCAFVPPCPVESDGPGMGMRRLASAEEFDRVARVEALREWARRGPWTGLWWTRGRMDGHSLMLTTASLPTEEEFVQMLKSRGEGADTPGEEGLWLQKTP